MKTPPRGKGRAPGRAGTASATRKVAIDFPASMHEQVETAASELRLNRSAFVRQAVAHYIDELHRRKLQEELAAGYIANAACASRVADEMMCAEEELA